jgi:phenylpropionate dioxygenase-like ring-hydroxylating dioxygenase large terminal subunit
MMSAQRNELITRTGPERPAGKLMRLYWQPAALVEELPAERPVKAIQLLGQNLVLFRDEQGRYGLVDRACPHRGADLAFGRLESGGLRCAFHGWLFDAGGKCLETPAEPEGSKLYTKVRHKAYPVRERNGILFAYLGPGEPPAFAHFDCFIAPDSYTFAFKGHVACNWLQTLEVGIDPAHASFLHRFFEDHEQAGNYGIQFRSTSADSTLPMTKIMREHPSPQIDTEYTDYGFRIITLRAIDDSRTHIRVTNLLFPNAFVIPLSPEMTVTQWQVPIDDVNCYWYAIFTSFGGPVDKETMRRHRLQLYTLPDYKPRLNATNDYGFNAAEQLHKTYTGMGEDINVHDQWAVESQGPVQDRTQEHLGASDKAIAVYRRILIDAIEQAAKGKRPLMVLDEAAAERIRGPVTLDGIADGRALESYWREFDARRRRGSAWAAIHLVE